MFICLSLVSGLKTMIPFHGINVDSCLTVHDVFQNIADGNFGMFLFYFPFDTSFFIRIKSELSFMILCDEGDFGLE